MFLKYGCILSTFNVLSKNTNIRGFTPNQANQNIWWDIIKNSSLLGDFNIDLKLRYCYTKVRKRESIFTKCYIDVGNIEIEIKTVFQKVTWIWVSKLWPENLVGQGLGKHHCHVIVWIFCKYLCAGPVIM